MADLLATTDLLTNPLWAAGADPKDGPPEERIATSYARAATVARHVNMSVNDITNLSPKFWNFHRDFILTADTAAATILTIHWNLCMGTIASYPDRSPALISILDELQRFESVGEFMLTEVGHGLDARNIETTATLDADGSFILHTPTPSAAKIMPPTTPHARMPRLAVVFAQLIVEGENRGIRPFIVRINSAETMAPGIVSRILPFRPGAKVVDHAVTTFHHVRLESWSLLGGLDSSVDARKDFFRHIHRVTVGTLSLSMTHIPVLRLSAYILGRYSQRRKVAGAKPSERIPIISFSTQYTPILTTLTFASVLDAFAAELCGTFVSTKEPRVRSGMACVFKQLASSASETSTSELVDRCGWQGLYSHNQIIELAMSLRGNSIAEGDRLVLCIRLVSELLLGRYELPKARNPKSLLAQHEASLWKEASRTSKRIMITPGSNRNDMFNSLILPRCSNLVTAIGHRMAYEAAEASDLVSSEVLNLFEATCILEDPAWYVEDKKLSTSAMHKRHAQAVGALLPRLDNMLEQTGAAPWVTSPILKEQDWEDFLERLPTFSQGDVVPETRLSGRVTPASEMTVQEWSSGSEVDVDITKMQEIVKEVYITESKAISKRRKWRWLLPSKLEGKAY